MRDIELVGVSKTFTGVAGARRTALSEISITILAGEFVTVIGANGSGKSTFLGAISGLVDIDTGRILFGGEDITRVSHADRALWISHVPQDPRQGCAEDLTVVENLALASHGRGWLQPLVTRPVRAAIRKRVQELRPSLLPVLNAFAGDLSGGERQAVALLLAAIRGCEVLLLDEHAAALDPKQAAEVMSFTDELAGRARITVVMVTHNLKDAMEHGSRLIVFGDGRVIGDFDTAEKTALTIEGIRQLYAAHGVDRHVGTSLKG
ncbi:MAG: ATP-binding cassette domain-containing protein [Planctomycetes bacterium]|nr:ATP-binding cassette domain-containing protein [Planctomycetota bacterium]